jgi:hypothetical protein
VKLASGSTSARHRGAGVEPPKCHEPSVVTTANAFASIGEGIRDFETNSQTSESFHV